MKNELLNVYYDLYDILGDVEAVADAIIDLTHTDKRRCSVVTHLEFTRLHNVDDELNQLYDMPIHKLKIYAEWWDSLRKVESDIEDK